MGQKLQCIHVGGFAALRNQLQVQHKQKKILRKKYKSSWQGSSLPYEKSE